MNKIEMLKLKTNSPGSVWKRFATLLLLVAAVTTFAAPMPAQPTCVGGKHDVDVMIVNLYVGGDIGRVMGLDPTDHDYSQNLVAAVTGVYAEIVASAPPVRLQTVANQITKRMPDIVAVEEASLVRVQSPGDLIVGGTTPATNVIYDYLQMLVADLKARGAHYKIVSTANEIDVELPMMNMQTGTIDDVRLNDREAILVRADLPPGQFRVSHPQSGNYANVIPALGLFVERGWCSVDVSIHGRDFRCLCTHLEEETAPQLQALQVQELLAGPAKTSLPVILLGDFNTDPLHRDGSFAYDLMPAAGFGDAWAKTHPRTPTLGLTWGHDEYLADPTTLFDRRIDLVFYRGKGLVPTDAAVVNLTTGLMRPPLWASDHAAVVAEFMLK